MRSAVSKSLFVIGPEALPGEVGGAADVDSAISAFVGRERELTALLSAFHRPGLVTVTGVPGIGKSRLAFESRRRLEAGAVPTAGPLSRLKPLFVSLSDDTDADTIGLNSAVVTAREAAFTDGTRRQPISWFDELLVLDDAGDPLHAADQVRSLLQDSPDSRLLVTSPGPLGLPGEQVLRLGPLWLAEDPERDQARPQDHPSVQLFIDRATTASVNLTLEESDFPVILELCQLLDGIPLAIELAAARAGAYPPAVLFSQLQGGMGFELLSAPAGDSLERHRSVRDALEWSYRTLPLGSQLLLDAVSAFSGSFSPEGAACVALPLAEDDVFDSLSTLVDYHLVEPVTTGSAVGRYELLQLVRRFARAHLVASGRAEETERLRTRYVSDLAKRAAAAFDRHDHAEAFATLEHEWPEITAVTTRMLANGEATGGLELTVDCAPFLLRMGFDASAHARQERLIEETRRQDATSPLLTRALLWSAVLTRMMPDTRPDPEWVHGRLEEGIARARSSGDRQALLMGFEFTVLCAAVTGDVAVAATATDEGLSLTSDGTDESWLARFEGLACMVKVHQGDIEMAGEYGLRSIQRAMRRNDHPAILRVGYRHPRPSVGGRTARVRSAPELRRVDRPLPRTQRSSFGAVSPWW